MANSDLLQEVTAAGWDQYITNIVMPGEGGRLLVRLGLFAAVLGAL
jgi:hypothetical protein